MRYAWLLPSWPTACTLAHAAEHAAAYHLFERHTSPQKTRQVEAEENDTLSDHGRAIRCAGCKTVITYHGNAEHRQGGHVHSFINPGGYEFTIGCFGRAWCLIVGQPSREWTWFSGYTWQYALCSQCREHLGWFYNSSSAENSFYGLILDRLIIDKE